MCLSFRHFPKILYREDINFHTAGDRMCSWFHHETVDFSSESSLFLQLHLCVLKVK